MLDPFSAPIERARERVDGLAWENSQHGTSECVCSHGRDDHDTEGVCQIRRCGCVVGESVFACVIDESCGMKEGQQ